MQVSRAEFDDVKELSELIGKTGGVSIYKATFGTYNLNSLIENSFLSITSSHKKQTGEEDSVRETISFMSINDGLSVIATDPDAYIKVLNAISHFIPISTNNVMFINFWILDENARNFESACTEMVKKAYGICTYVDYLVWVVPKNYHPSEYIQRIFSIIDFQSLDGNDASTTILNGYKVLFLHRSNYVPKLLVREARIEDNDDLIPILQNSNPDILMGQESYFLADLIQTQDKFNSFYVGLRKSSIEGMLATSLDVNVSLIQKVFDISPYPDLMIKKEERPLPPPLLISIIGDLRLVDFPTLQEAAKRLNCLLVDAESMALALPEVVPPPPAVTLVSPKTAGKSPSVTTAKSPTAAGESKKSEAKEAESKKAESKDEPVVSAPVSTESPLKTYLDGLLRRNAQDGNVPPSAVILFGYPRNENEAYERLEEMMHHFDYLVELHNTTEEAEEDEDDDFLQHHLDAVEVLREKYQSPEAKSPGNFQSAQNASAQGHKAAWRKVAVTSGNTLGSSTENDTNAVNFNKIDAVQNLAHDLTRIVDHRNMRIEAQRQKDREEPPMANAFAVTVFCMTDDFLSRGEDLIKIAFEDHPNHEFCLYMTSNDKPPPPDLVRCLTYVKTLPGVSFNQSLYLMHRSSFLVNDHMHVLRLDRPLLPALEGFAQSLKQPVMVGLLDAAGSCLLHSDVDLRDNPAEVCFAITIGSTVVGAVTLSRKLNSNEDATWFRSNYHIDELINFERHRVRNQSVITQWVLDPVYSPFARRILQEIMRMCGKTLLYYQSERDVCPPKNILEEFVSLKPRRRMQSGGNLRSELVDRPSASIGGLGNDCPLYCITKHFLSNPKDTIARRVVVVGGSCQSYALLDTLCSVPYLNFPNIFVVMDLPPSAISFEQKHSEESKHEDNYSGCFSMQNEHYPLEQELFAMGLGHKVNLLQGHLTDIDREHKAIVISDEKVLEYDVLVLSTCTRDGSTKSFPSVSRLHPARCADIGVFSLGSPLADLQALRYIRHRYNQRSDDVVVSGSGLPVFAAVARLLNTGVAPTRITVVVKEDEGFIEGLTEKNIYEPLLKGVLSVGVKMCWGFGVADVHMSQSGFLNSIELKRSSELLPKAAPRSGQRTNDDDVHAQNEHKSAEEPLMLACMALLCCANSVCDKDVFTAVVDSGLVFDGGLVVDASFRTVDPWIYGLSDYTRFSRVYKDVVPHSTYNPTEVGSFVALKILEQQLDPTLSRPHRYANTDAANSAMMAPYVNKKVTHRAPLPVFRLPRAVSCDLPGKLFYFNSRLPDQPAEAIGYLTNGQSTDGTPGGITSAPRNRNFMLKTDLLGTLVEVLYVGEDAIENRNLSLLPGIHETFLNSAVHTHGKGYIADWVEFFRQEWASVIYQDKFPVLVHALRRSLASDKGMLMMLSRIFERAENTVDMQELADVRREIMGAHGELVPETTMRTVQTGTIEFLKDNRALLPRFYLPAK